MARNYNFAATVDSWIADSKARSTAIVRQSLQELIEEAQTPVGKGGRMRVDTGFLRASGQISLTGMPSGPARNDADAPAPSPPDVAVTLAKVDIGDTVYFGWTANYAKYRELYDGFLIGAIHNWQSIVTKNVRRLQARAAFRQ